MNTDTDYAKWRAGDIIADIPNQALIGRNKTAKIVRITHNHVDMKCSHISFKLSRNGVIENGWYAFRFVRISPNIPQTLTYRINKLVSLSSSGPGQ